MIVRVAELELVGPAVEVATRLRFAVTLRAAWQAGTIQRVECALGIACVETIDGIPRVALALVMTNMLPLATDAGIVKGSATALLCIRST